MFYSLTGKLVYSDSTSAAVNCNGIAFLCRVSVNTLKKLGQEGSEVTLYTILSFRQDGMDLYGFANQEERDFFNLLTSVSGVGPKAALSILSSLEPSKLALSIASEDYRALTAAQGVGPKVAKRIVLELKDKIAREMQGTVAAGTSAAAAGDAPIGNSVSETISALVMLGYSQAEASHAVESLDPSLPTEKLLKLALKNLSR